MHSPWLLLLLLLCTLLSQALQRAVVGGGGSGKGPLAAGGGMLPQHWARDAFLASTALETQVWGSIPDSCCLQHALDWVVSRLTCLRSG